MIAIFLFMYEARYCCGLKNERHAKTSRRKKKQIGPPSSTMLVYVLTFLQQILLKQLLIRNLRICFSEATIKRWKPNSRPL